VLGSLILLLGRYHRPDQIPLNCTIILPRPAGVLAWQVSGLIFSGAEDQETFPTSTLTWVFTSIPLSRGEKKGKEQPL
jgi:hypothetical protein